VEFGEVQEPLEEIISAEFDETREPEKKLTPVESSGDYQFR
jgi:hypothetical protein